jgi:hypothetical protein
MATDAQKKARNKWNKEHRAAIACSLDKEVAERFKRYAEEHETTPSSILRELVIKFLDEHTQDSSGTDSTSLDNDE